MDRDQQPEASLVPAGETNLLRTYPLVPAMEVWEKPEPSEVPLAEALRIVLRRYRIVLACLVLVVGVTAYHTWTAPRIYEATATFLVSDSREDASSALADDLPPMAKAISAPWLETHASLMAGPAAAKATADWLASHGGPKLSAGAVAGDLSTRIVPKTQLVELRAKAGSPREAQRVANAAASCYVALNQRLAQGASASAGHYLKDQLEVAKDNLALAEHALRDYKESTGTVANDAEAAGLLGRSASIRTELDSSEADLAQARQRLENVRTQLAQQNSRISVSQVRDNTVVQQLRERLVQMEGERLAALARYTSEMPAPTKALDKQIALTKQQLETELRSIVSTGGGDLVMQQSLTSQLSQAEIEVASLTARAQELELRLKETDQQLSRVPARQIRLARLQREVSVAQDIHEDLLRRSQENEVGRVMSLGNATLVEPAALPGAPVSPRTQRDLLFGLLLGLALGVGVALVLEQLDDAVVQEADVVRVAEAPVVETVPVLPSGDITGMLAQTRQPRRALEAYSGLRYNLGYLPPREGGRAVLVTSAAAGEGKTTTAVNLAIAAALGGRRTVLVDGDMRRPTVSRLLSLGGEKGLSEYLSGQASVEDILQNYGELGLTVISSGAPAPNPTNLLDSERMAELVEALRRQADLIIFDSVPMLSAADALILAGQCDAVFLVAVPGASRRHAVGRSRALLANVGRAFAGVILNKVPVHRGYGYHYGYYAERRYQTIPEQGAESRGRR